jgi:hypothetical protein
MKKIKRQKQPWPTKKVMEQVYEKNLWGGGVVDFYSGDGSHHKHLVAPYLKAVISFLNSFKKKLVVCDLGCGDFTIGKELVPFSDRYIAVDIVAPLIAFNKEKFQFHNLTFQCLDIAEDELPVGDCAIVRQVLQHLSNVEIEKIVRNLQSFKYVILTEHLPNGEFLPNVDIISGQGIRNKKNSGIDILQAPFYLKVKDCKKLVSIDLGTKKGIVVTTLYTL